MYKKPKNDISTSGLHLDLETNFMPESRKPFYDRIKSIIGSTNSQESNTQANLILASWGEGKTHLFEKFIPKNLDQNQISLSIDTATIVQILKEKKTFKLSLPDEIFLYAVFKGLQDYGYLPEVFENLTSEDAQKYLGEVFSKLQEKFVNVYILIDELENILIERENVELQKDLLIGLKNCLNENSQFIKKSNGLLQFFLGCTPSAFNQIERHSEFNEIIGGLERRLNIIHIPSIRKFEAFEFIVKVLKYAWLEEFPFPFIFENYNSTISLIARLGLYNFGFIQSLIAKIIKCNKKMDYNELLDFLINSPSSNNSKINYVKREIYNVFNEISTRTIGKEFLDYSIINSIPISLKDINEKFSLEFKTLIEFNIDIKGRFSKRNFFIKMFKVKNNENVDRKIQNHFDKFQYYEKDNNREEFYKIHDYRISKKDFEEKLFFNMVLEKSDKIQKEWFIPADSDAFHSLFPNIQKDFSEHIVENLKEAVGEFDNKDPYILTNPNLMDLIFPTKIPFEIDFINDKNIVQEWWDSLDDFETNFKKYYFVGLQEILKNLLNFKLKNENKKNPKFNIYSSEFRYQDQEFELNFIIPSYHIRIINDDIKRLNKFVNENNIKGDIIHFCYLITSEIIDEGEKKYLAFKELENNKYFPIYLNHFIPQREYFKDIMFYGKYILESSNYDIEISQNKFKTFQSYLIQELDFEKIVADYFLNAEKKGFVIHPFIFPETFNLKKLKESFQVMLRMSYFQHPSQTELFEQYKKLKSLKYFYDRVNLITIPGDIESISEFEQRYNALVQNNLIIYENNNVTFPTSKIENRILKFLEFLPEKEWNQKEIGKYFHNMVNDANIIDFYLEILRNKGILDFSNNSIQKADILENRIEIMKKVEEFISKHKENSKFYLINHIFHKKQRDQRLMLLEDYFNILEFYKSQLDKDIDDYSKRAYLILINEIIEYFDKNINWRFENNQRIMNSEIKRFETDIAKLKIEMSTFHSKLSDYIEDLPTIDTFKEFQDIEKKLDKYQTLKGMFESFKSKQEFLNYIGTLDDEDLDLFLNSKPKKMPKKDNLLIRSGNLFIVLVNRDILRIFYEIKEKYSIFTSNFEKIDREIVNIKTNMMSELRKIRPEFPITTLFYDNYYKDIENQAITIEINGRDIKSFADIDSKLMGISVNISNDLETIKNNCEKIKKLKYEEKRIVNHFKEINDIFSKIDKKLLEEDKLKSDFENFKNLNSELYKVNDCSIKNIDKQIKMVETLIQNKNPEQIYSNIYEFLAGNLRSIMNYYSLIKKYVKNKKFEIEKPNINISRTKKIDEINANYKKLVKLLELLQNVEIEEDLNEILSYINKKSNENEKILEDLTTKDEIIEFFKDFNYEIVQNREELWSKLLKFKIIEVNYKFQL